MGNVVEFTGLTTLDTPPERILSKAQNADLKDAIVVGRDKDGELYFQSSVADGAEINWLLDLAKIKLHEICKD